MALQQVCPVLIFSEISGLSTNFQYFIRRLSLFITSFQPYSSYMS